MAYRKATIAPDLVIEALTPLFFAKMADFIKKTSSLTPSKAEALVDKDCLIFEEEKSWLIDNWPG